MSVLRISELSAATGVPVTTLRYYEGEGLLPVERGPNGYRLYDERARQRLAFITAAKRVNLTLPQIKDLLQVWENDSCRAVKAQLRPVVAGHITQIETTISQLTALRDTLVDAQVRLDRTPDAATPCDAGCSWLTSATVNSR